MTHSFFRTPGGGHEHRIPPIVPTENQNTKKKDGKENNRPHWAPDTDKILPNTSFDFCTAFFDVQSTDSTQTLAEKYGEVREYLGGGGWGEVRLAHKSINEDISATKPSHHSNTLPSDPKLLRAARNPGKESIAAANTSWGSAYKALTKALQVFGREVKSDTAVMDKTRQQHKSSAKAAETLRLNLKAKSETLVAIKIFRPTVPLSKMSEGFQVKHHLYRPDQEYLDMARLNKFEKKMSKEYFWSWDLDHPNVVKALDLMRDDKGRLCIALELCGAGCFLDSARMGDIDRQPLEREEADCFFMQFMRGLSYLHSRNITHYDLKLNNLILTVNGCVKIADFGHCLNWATMMRLPRGHRIRPESPQMLPPQCFNDRRELFDPRTLDIWAAGMIYIL
ncbi:serine/threonine-protein kinase HAL4/sat4 [Cadophora gregata]|uniref:serine/threonine-protein kinase HAL4/sat4 n=1 Tax=Cadophora gregata TaxID=51156 RepID=UPI0026DDC197|nr:serine/threonine-protein kinase HAL4/sat4 [Cadophora gregata]KAK0105755.1 serine/threonine-protein kinase HAL4/sat4 [Cadophora gregata]